MTSNPPLFALPDHLSAKADPDQIEADERHLRAISDALDEQISDLESRRDAERLAPAGTGQQALDRDLEVHRLTGRLRVLRKFRLDLCLGRIIFADTGDALYVGRVGLVDGHGERLLVDWRAPAAAPFFSATHADPMGIASRRRFRWTAGRVTDYWDEAFTSDGTRPHAALDDHSAFVASLGESRSERMRDVLGTIQADQDAIIRAESRGALVVDGGPGTGKTVVALHRAASLLYSDTRVRRGGILFVGPNPAYLAYVGDVLPSLGEDGVQTCTLNDLVPEGAAALDETDPAVVRLTSSADLTRAIDAAVSAYESPPTTELVIETPWRDLTLTAADWSDVFAAADRGLAHNDAREQVWGDLLDLLVDRHDEDDAPPDAIRRSLLQDAGLVRAFAQAWPVLDPVGVVADLWSVPGYLERCAPWLAPDEVRALRRPDPRAWTTQDLPLLDAARHRIGDPEAPHRRRRREAAQAEDRERMTRVVDDLIASHEMDDGEGVMTMLRGEDVRFSLADESTLPSSDPDLLAGPFAHIVVDEAQELTDAQWQMLRRRCPSGSFTIVGDRAQARHGFRLSWEERLAEAGLHGVRLSTLGINYRTPEEVMSEAAPVIRAAVPDANVPTSVRRSGIPVRHEHVDALETVLREWAARDPEGTAVVIGGDAAALGAVTSDRRVRAMTPELAKGLEFDLVVLIDPESLGAGIEGAVDRYVAMTRATRELVVLGR